MNNNKKLYLVKMDQADLMPNTQSTAAKANSSETGIQERRRLNPSLPFEEISKRHPGRFIDGNAELESKGITGFILPGGKPQEENEATAEDWAEFNRNEEGLTKIVLEHIEAQKA